MRLHQLVEFYLASTSPQFFFFSQKHLAMIATLMICLYITKKTALFQSTCMYACLELADDVIADLRQL